MRLKVLLILIIPALFAVRAAAQGGKFQLEVGLSFGLYDRSIAKDTKIAMQPDYGNEKYYTTDRSCFLPVFDLTMMFNFKDIGLGVGLENVLDHAYCIESGEVKSRETIFYTLPCIRYYHRRARDISIYSTLAFGPRFRQYSSLSGGVWSSDLFISGSWLLVPVGISFGEKLFISVDAAVGAAWSPVKLSLGYRF